MSAIKPFGKVAFVGKTVGALALGLGFRTRETVVEIIEKKDDPFDEMADKKRCVLPEATVRLLLDLGMTQGNLKRVLRPAGKWKFVTAQLDLMREGDSYVGAASGERCYHIPQGQLIRVLRQDFCKFGGSVQWQTTAEQPFPTMDESKLWSLRKEWGTMPELHMIANFSRTNIKNFAALVFDQRQRLPYISFNRTRGWTDAPPRDLMNEFGSDYDVIFVLGKEVAMTVWRCGENQVEWQLVSQASSGRGMNSSDEAQKKRVAQGTEEFHPTLRTLMTLKNQKNCPVRHDLIRLPLERPKLLFEDETLSPLDEAFRRLAITSGDSVIPVDPFGWRGDAAALAISEASNLTSRLFLTTRKFHRGDTPHELRQFELDCITRRFSTSTTRDLKDAEMFLTVNPELPRDDDDTPEQARIA